MAEPDRSGAQPAAPRTDTDSQVATHHIPMYRVLIHNDPKTTFDFVIAILGSVFAKSLQDADRIAQDAHHRGLALVTVLPLEQAEFKVDRAHSLARAAKFPLRFTYERVD